MHLSSNISHWVCVVAGLLLVTTGLLSHAKRTAELGRRSQQSYPGMMRRVTLITMGLFAVFYGISRMLLAAW